MGVGNSLVWEFLSEENLLLTQSGLLGTLLLSLWWESHLCLGLRPLCSWCTHTSITSWAPLASTSPGHWNWAWPRLEAPNQNSTSSFIPKSHWGGDFVLQGMCTLRNILLSFPGGRLSRTRTHSSEPGGGNQSKGCDCDVQTPAQVSWFPLFLVPEQKEKTSSVKYSSAGYSRGEIKLQWATFVFGCGVCCLFSKQYWLFHEL